MLVLIATYTQTFQYFSFTTLTTLTGQVFLATLVARLVSAYRGQGGRAHDRD